MAANSNALTQNAQGRWDLTLKHDKPNVNLQIPARLTYDGIQVSTTITNVEKTINTDWYTELGVPINPDDIDKYAQPITKDGKTYIVTAWTFDVKEYKDSGTTAETIYSVEVLPKTASIASNGHVSLTSYYVGKQGDTEVSRINVTNVATWSSNNNYVVVNGGSVSGNNTSSLTTRSSRVTAAYSGKSAYCDVTIGKASSGSVVTHRLVVEPATTTIPYDGYKELTATFYTITDGQPVESIDVTDFVDCIWTSNKENVATVSAGHVTAHNESRLPETVRIEASYCGYTGNSEITVDAKGGDFEFNIDIDPEFLYDDHTIVIKYFVNEEEHGDFTRPVIRVNSNAEWSYQTIMNRPPEANPSVWFITTKTPTGEDYNAVINFTTVQFDANRLSNRNGKIEFYSGPNVEEGELLASFDVVEASHIWVDPNSLAYDRVGETKQVTIEGYGFYDVEENADWFSVTGDIAGEDYGQFKNHIDVRAEDNETQFSRKDRVIVKPKYNDDIEITVRQTPSMFSVSPSEYTFDSTGETVELNIQTQQYWLAVIDSGCEDWVSLDRNTGTTTNTKLNVTVSDNTGGSVRGCFVKFYDYYDQTRQLGSFRINQSEGDSITLNPETIIGIGSTGDVRTVNVIANGSWEILPDIEIITPTGITFEPDVTFDKTSGNGNDSVTVTIGPNTIDAEIRLGIKFRRGSAEATLSLWQQTAPAPDLNIYDANGVQLFDNSEVVIDSEGGIIPFKVVCNNDWSATIYAYEADGITYFAYPGGLPTRQTFSGSTGETLSNVEVRRTESAEDRNGTITFASYYGGSGRKEVTIRLKRTGVSDFVPYAVSDVYIRMEDVSGNTMEKQGPFTDTVFGDLEGDIKNMYINGYLSGNGASVDGVIVDFGVWDINNVAEHNISGCNWDNVTQVSSYTCTNISEEEQVNINLGPLGFLNNAGQQSMAIALRVTVGGTSYYAKLDEASTVPSEKGFILFTNSFYAIYI